MTTVTEPQRTGTVGGEDAARPRPASGLPTWVRPPGLDIAAFAALLAVNAFTGGAFARLELSGNAVRLSEISLLLIALLAVHRLGIRRSAELLRRRGALLWLGLLLTAVVVALVRGLEDLGFSQVLYDIQLYDLIVAVPLIILLADDRRRFEWLLGAILLVAAIATILFLFSETISRATESAPLLADGEGEVGAGALYACLVGAAALAALARGGRAGRHGIAVGCLAMFLIGFADKRTAWVALAAGMILVFVLSRPRRGAVALGLVVFAVAIAGSLALNTATEVSKAERLALGPLEGTFEDSTEGWKAYGTAALAMPSVTREWSARGEGAMRAEFSSASHDQSGYLFARSCCAEGGGLSVEPGQRYAAAATIRVEEAPPAGISVQLNYYRDDGTFGQIRNDESRRRLHSGEKGRIGVLGRAPREARIVGIQIGPVDTIDAGERAAFDVDDVILAPASEAKGRIFGAGAGNIDTNVGPDDGGSGVGREFSGLLGGESIEGQNVEWRLDYWEELIGRLGDDPEKIPAGAGFGPMEFERAGTQYDFRTEGSSDSNNVTGPHNAFISTIYTTGLIGLIGLIGLLTTVTVRLAQALRGAADSSERVIALALIGTFTISLAHMSLTEAPRTPEQGLFLWATVGLGLAWAAVRKAEPGADRPAGSGLDVPTPDRGR